jgi:hypothetical protein
VHHRQRSLQAGERHRLCPPRRCDEDSVIPDVPLPRADASGREGQPQTFLAGAQRLRFAVLDDGNGRRVRADVDQLPMPLGRTTRRRKIEGEGSEHVPFCIEDRARPARTQTMRKRHLAVALPQRVRRNVLDDHQFAAMGGGAA